MICIDREWPYKVAAYYAEGVAPPKKADELAFETRHRTEASAGIDVLVARDRQDIGRIDFGPRYIEVP